jgi:hypothetical protein
MDERLRFVARLLEGEKMAPVCRQFGISRVAGYKIFNRYKECGLDALNDRSRRPYQHANKLPFQVERSILGIKREHSSWGAPKIRLLEERMLLGCCRRGFRRCLLTGSVECQSGVVHHVVGPFPKCGLPWRLTGRDARPVTAPRYRHAELATSFRKCDVGQPEILRELSHGLRPDELVEAFPRQRQRIARPCHVSLHFLDWSGE